MIQWFHVLLGIVWFGGTLYLNFVAIPAVMTLPLDQQQSLMTAGHHIFYTLEREHNTSPYMALVALCEEKQKERRHCDGQIR